MFIGARRFHKGGKIGPGERPIIAKIGERVLTEQQNRAWEAGHVRGGLGGGEQGQTRKVGGGVQQNTFSPVISISMPEGSSKGMGETERAALEASLKSDLSIFMEDFIAKKSRPGGPLYNGK